MLLRLRLLALVLVITYHRAFTATDDCGNATSRLRRLHYDTTAPELRSQRITRGVFDAIRWTTLLRQTTVER